PGSAGGGARAATRASAKARGRPWAAGCAGGRYKFMGPPLDLIRSWVLAALVTYRRGSGRFHLPEFFFPRPFRGAAAERAGKRRFLEGQPEGTRPSKPPRLGSMRVGVR